MEIGEVTVELDQYGETDGHCWVESRMLPGLDKPSGDTHRVSTLEVRRTRLVKEGESFESVAGDSMAFLPSDVRPQPKDYMHFQGSLKSLPRGNRFSTYVEEFEDGSKLTSVFNYDPVPADDGSATPSE